MNIDTDDDENVLYGNDHETSIDQTSAIYNQFNTVTVGAVLVETSTATEMKIAINYK